MSSLYTVYFEDGTNFEGKKWSKIPDKLITSLTYHLENKDITFENYQSYNHIIERVSKFGDTKITKIMLMGTYEYEVNILVIDFIKKNFYVQKSPMGKEYEGRPTTGWRKGLSVHKGSISYRETLNKRSKIIKL